MPLERRSTSKLVVTTPPSPSSARLAAGHNNLGFLLLQAGKPIDAEAEYCRALEIHQKLADDNPKVADHRRRIVPSLRCPPPPRATC